MKGQFKSLKFKSSKFKKSNAVACDLDSKEILHRKRRVSIGVRGAGLPCATGVARRRVKRDTEGAEERRGRGKRKKEKTNPWQECPCHIQGHGLRLCYGAQEGAEAVEVAAGSVCDFCAASCWLRAGKSSALSLFQSATRRTCS